MGILLYYFYERKKLYNAHKREIASLSAALTAHSYQIDFRRKNLDRYNFSIYNLEESLVAQPQIDTKNIGIYA